MEGFSEGSDRLSTQLLEAIWQIFAEKKVVRLHTKVLVDALMKIEEAPWVAANEGREIDGYWLREKLKGFLPRPANPEEAAALHRSRIWREGKGAPLKGYTEDHLREAWWRYLERKTPTETAKAAGAAAGPTAGAANGGGRPSADQPIETETATEAGFAADGEDENRGQGHACGERRPQRPRTGEAPHPPERGQASGEA